MPKYNYDTEKEAQEALEESRAKGLGFCPLIKQLCHTDCISYDKGHLYGGNGGRWRVQYPWCSNVLISGIITVHNAE